MTEGNTQFVLHNDSVEFLTGMLTMLAQILRVMRQHEDAERVETIRNTMQCQFYS